jgi:predicted acylesterase/phospholipase RssA
MLLKSCFRELDILSDSKITIELEEIQPEERRKPKCLVISGGSVRGIAHLGALQCLSEMNLLDEIDSMAGSSIGGLIVALLCIGYKPLELYEFNKKYQFERLKQLDYDDFFFSYGIDKGKRVEFVIKKLIKHKLGNEDVTLKEVFDKTKINLFLTTSCLNDDSVKYLNHVDDPDLPLHLAIRMSISIPIFYVPVLYQGKYYIDGGCKDNYPINLFHDRKEYVLGLCIRQHGANRTINGFTDYMYYLVMCMINHSSRDLQFYKDKTILISIQDIGVFDFDLTVEKKEYLFKTGFDAAATYYALTI